MSPLAVCLEYKTNNWETTAALLRRAYEEQVYLRHINNKSVRVMCVYHFVGLYLKCVQCIRDTLSLTINIYVKLRLLLH